MAKTLFTPVHRKVKDLIGEVLNGKLGLPELQRGYVWSSTKVKNLLDSMLKGYPIGYLMVWESSFDMDKTKQIGINDKAYSAPKGVVIDGQQRLTSLYSVMCGKHIIDENFKEKPIVISFNPVTREFKVGDNSTKRAADWIYDISEVYTANQVVNFEYIQQKIKQIAESREKQGSEFTDEEKESVISNFMDLLSLEEFPIPTLEISENADEESVADIFVRVNSGGTSLAEDDFILTLISVYWQEGRQKIEDFCRNARKPIPKTPYNFLFQPTPTHIVRIATGFGFKRARLKYAYMMLRGRDFEKGIYSTDLREQRFDELKIILDKVLDLNVWHDFIKSIETAGFINKNLISAGNALAFSYVMYLIGKYDYKVNDSVLRKLIAKWFFMVSTSGYYTSSAETEVEKDFADLRNVKTAEDFEKLLNEKINAVFTNDYFDITVPNALATSAPRSPVWFGYCAAQNILGAKVLFSQLTTRELHSPVASGKKSALERHHLFPKAYLAKIGIKDDRERNQNANYAFIEWRDNIEILDISPAEYMKEQIAKIPAYERKLIYSMHALPDNWEKMEYADFLIERRKLMAKVIKNGFKKL
ncbi:MAG: DUF262 domain-containing protein [Oscillospiraceae bacterium]|nr:DUF262 domain-containing protein [Oscillospiraceae bacterium]